MKKGIIAIQFYGGDKAKAMRLARLIADIEPVRRDDIDFVFIARADCDHDSATAEYVSRKFNVRKLKCLSLGTGHPWGCWVLWFSLMEWFYHMKSQGKISDYKWVFAIEADCVPISKTWIDECDAEFERFNTCMVGAESSDTFNCSQHLNGNVMVTGNPDFLKWLVMGITVSGVPVKQPWDIYLFPKFTEWGVGFSEKNLNRCGQRTMEHREFEWLRKHGWAFVHGVKDDSLIHHAREALIRR